MENTMDDEMNCPLCLMTVRSDAYTQKYCSLCGMDIDVISGISIRRKNRKFNFCSLSCKSKFLKIGFRSLNMFKINKMEGENGML